MTTGAGVPLRFWLVRTNDVRDGSTWIVAEGTQFSDGLLVVSTPGVGTVCWSSIEEMLDGHCAEGETVLHWLDRDRVQDRVLV
jgi:hypothetical protein